MNCEQDNNNCEIINFVGVKEAPRVFHDESVVGDSVLNEQKGEELMLFAVGLYLAGGSQGALLVRHRRKENPR